MAYSVASTRTMALASLTISIADTGDVREHGRAARAKHSTKMSAAALEKRIRMITRLKSAADDRLLSRGGA